MPARSSWQVSRKTQSWAQRSARPAFSTAKQPGRMWIAAGRPAARWREGAHVRKPERLGFAVLAAHLAGERLWRRGPLLQLSNELLAVEQKGAAGPFAA